MKKTIIITLEFSPQIGGIATYVERMAAGFDPTSVVVVAPHHKQAKAWDAAQPYKIIRTTLLFPRFLWPRWIRACYKLWRIAKKEKAELVMVHHVLPMGYAARFVKKVLGIPYLIFSHGTDVIAATRSKRKTALVRRLIAAADQVIVNSVSLKRRFLRPFPEARDRVTVLYPCPEDTFYTAPPKKEIDMLRSQLALKGKKVVLTIARMVDGKGFPHLADVMVQVAEKMPNVVWVIVGDGPKRELVLGYMRKKSLQNIIRYVGMVPHAELKTYYYLADVFALLTHPDNGLEEGLGLVFLEAAASGLPAVAGKSGGVEEAVIHMQTGIMVDAYHHQESVSAIHGLLTDPAFAKRLGTAAKERMSSQFIWENQLKNLEPWTGPVLPTKT